MVSSFSDGVIDFVWACWGAVGVPAPVRRPIAAAVDVEPLIRITNAIGSRDQRLAAHAQAWQQSFPELVSRTRLKRLGGNPDLAPVLPERSVCRPWSPARMSNPATKRARGGSSTAPSKAG